MKELSRLQSAKRSRLALLISVVTAILVIAFMVLLVPLSSCAASTTSTPIPRDALDVVSLKPCGKTRDEALARGCQFDLMSFVWTPPACHDKELPDDFLSLRNWTWYHDIKATQVADEHLVHRGKFDHLYVTWEYHKVHCAYMWRKLHRAMMSGSRVDGYIGTRIIPAIAWGSWIKEELILNLSIHTSFRTFLSVVSRAWGWLYDTLYILMFRLEVSQLHNGKSQCVI